MSANNGSIIYTIRGPIMLVTVGVLFALNNFTPYGFHSTWPVLLIVFGLMTLLGRGVSPAPPTAPHPPCYQPPYEAQYTPPPPQESVPPGGPGGYRSSPYAGGKPPAEGSGGEA